MRDEERDARTVVLGWALCLAAALVGCGDEPVPRTDAGRDAWSSDGYTSDAPAGETLASLLAADPDLSMWVAASERAGLVEVLAGPGTYTVLAPTNEAFAASGITRTMIAVMPLAQLRTLLRYHALAAEAPSDAITAGPVATLAMLTLFLGTDGGVIVNGGNTVVGGANVVRADVEASNGVLHVVDRVLLPPNVVALARYGGLTTLSTALTDAGLVDELSAPGPFTFFAPTNEAFTALVTVPTGDALEQVLLLHVAPGSITSADVPPRAPSLARNAYADPLSLVFDTHDGVMVNARSTVVLADLHATNGIVHVIDEVLLPMNVVEGVIAAGLTGLIGTEAVASGLPGGTSVFETLAMPGPYTVFAPTNDAFTVASSAIETLSPAQIRDVLLYHVLSPTTFRLPVLEDDLPTSTTRLVTLNDASIPFEPSPAPTVDGASIVLADIVVTNGVIHVIDEVMEP